MVTLRATDEATEEFPLIDVPVPKTMTVDVPGVGARDLELPPHEVVDSMLAPSASSATIPQMALPFAVRRRPNAISNPANAAGITKILAALIEGSPPPLVDPTIVPAAAVMVTVP